MGARRGRAWRYARFDGTQPAEPLDAEEVLGALADDLLYHGDLDAALRRLLQRGFSRRDGDPVLGIRELLERIGDRRAQLQSSGSLGAMAEAIGAELDAIVAEERAELDAQERAALEAQGTGAPNEPGGAPSAAARRAVERRAELDLLPSGLAARLSALSDYDFASASARERFARLVERARAELAGLQLEGAAALAQSPEERARLRDGLDALNRMLEQRAAGEPLDPTFEAFTEHFGDLFPPATDLDDLLDKLGARMAAASALLASLSPDQRRELDALTAELLADVDLAWQLDRLGANLRTARPALSWDEAGSGGAGTFPLLDPSDAVGQLAELAGLEAMLRRALEPGGLAEVDPEAVAALLGANAAASLAALAELTRRLEEAGLIARTQGRLALTPRGQRRLGAHALGELFARLGRDRFGHHDTALPGAGRDRAMTTRPYEFGDPFELDVERTIRNALVRRAAQRPAAATGRGVELPIRLAPEDFEIEEREQLVTAATVVALDLSLSMPMRENFLAAKKVAFALESLIASRYPRDFLGLVGFSATARTIRPAELPELSWDFAYGTNLEHALALSRSLLAHRHGTKQVILITDGEPTAHTRSNGEVFFNYPPAPETIAATLAELERCTRAGIRVNTFVLDATEPLRRFVEEMTKRNRGRAFFVDPGSLGDYVLVDFVEGRGTRRRMRPGA